MVVICPRSDEREAAAAARRRRRPRQQQQPGRRREEKAAAQKRTSPPVDSRDCERCWSSAAKTSAGNWSLSSTGRALRRGDTELGLLQAAFTSTSVATCAWMRYVVGRGEGRKKRQAGRQNETSQDYRLEW